LIAAAMGARAFLSVRTSLAVDEAESAINAFSILQHGYPTATYLGIPIYENMLVRPWPEHPEYEFKDISYSDRGMAVYHGWLPLYAIAGSFRLFDIDPPRRTPGWQVSIDPARYRWRTIAARAPTFVSAAALLVLMFIAARRAVGADAALAVLVLAGLSDSVIAATIQARYYVFSLALSAAAWLTLRLLREHGSWGRILAHALILTALFYTNIIVCPTLIVLTTIALVVDRSTWTTIRRWSVAVVLIGALAVPWIVGTGFVDHLQYVPSGRPLLHFPHDLVTYALDRIRYLAVFLVAITWIVVLSLTRARHALAGTHDLWRRHATEYVLLIVWMAIAVATWWLLMPPASLFPQRLSLAMFVPGLLLLAMFLADASRLVTIRRSIVLAPVLAGIFLGASGLLRWPSVGPYEFAKIADTFARLNALHLRPDAKVYAAPGSHLILTFYGDKPIQSLAPVRKSFLDNWPGEIVHIESRFEWEFGAPDATLLLASASRLGTPIGASEAADWAERLRSRVARERTAPLVDAISPPLESLPPFAEVAMVHVRARVLDWTADEHRRWEHVPFSRGMEVYTAADLWQVFFYRLVDPASRRGSHLNAADRLRHGVASFVPSGNRVVFYSPRPVSTDALTK
jgi:hypothetical protein